MAASAGGGGEPESDRDGTSSGSATTPSPRDGARDGDTTRSGAQVVSRPRAGAGDDGGSDEGWLRLSAQRLGVDTSGSSRKVRRGLVLAAAGLLLSTLAGWALEYWSIGPFASAEHRAEEANDAAEPPFRVSVQPERSEPSQWAMVLDRELTEAEARTLTSLDPSAAFSYLRKLGGHPLAYAAFLENAPRYDERHQDRLEFADVIKLNIVSGREKAVLIDDWKVVDVRCRRSTAKAAVVLPPQGGVPYEGVRLHIPPQPDEPVLTDDTEGQGEWYFSTRRIEVGGGQPSAGWRMETLAARGRSCTWGVKVHYGDAYGNEGWVRLADDEERPLVFRTESLPAEPRQLWLTGSVPWTACHEDAEEPLCAL